MKRLIRLSKIVFCVFLLLPWIRISASSSLQLSAQEQQFIQDHPVIRLGVDPSFIPYEFIDDDGTYSGMAKDYLDLISEKTGLTFEVASGLTWSEAYEKVINKQLDLCPAIAETPEREKYFLFSEPYLSFQRAIFVLSSNKSITGFSDLNNKTVAVQAKSSHAGYLAGFPLINLSLYDTVDDALQALSEGKETAFVGNLATTSYLMRKLGITNLKSLIINDGKSSDLKLAVRNDWAPLVSILDKALNAITDKEKIEIQNRWIGLTASKDYTDLFNMILMVGAFLGLGLAVSAFWIIRLGTEIRERKKLENELKVAKDAAITANEAKSSFLARMSHEIRTPLHAISGMAYLTQRSGLNPIQDSYMVKIQHASEDMLDVINDILDYSKIEAGKTELEKIEFELDVVLEHLINLVAHKAYEQGIRFELITDPMIPKILIGDPKRLRQILLNLLNNAVKFTEKGQVILTIRLIDKTSDQVELGFEVNDTGIGMTDEQISKIFDPFTQADSSINRRFGGSGLGLSISRNLIELMGGKIQVISEYGTGTAMSFSARFGLNPDHQEMAFSGRITDSVKILLICDAVEKELLMTYFKAFKMEVTWVENPGDAINLIRQSLNTLGRRYSLVMIDDDSLQNQGLACAADIKSIRGLSELKVALLMRLADPKITEIYQNPNLDMILTKPIIPSLLFNAMAESIKKTAGISRPKPTENKLPAYRILVVDDNETNRFIAKGVLEGFGLTVITANDGQEAIERCLNSQDQPDLILMDLHMPILDGYEATKRLRLQGQSIPIIAMTADVIESSDEKLKAAGFNGSVSKPFDPDALIRYLRDQLSGKVPSQAGSAVSKSSQSLDQTAGMRNVSNNKTLYLKILRIYLSENEPTLASLNALLQIKDYQEAAKVVHKLKGSTGTIGATPLYDLCIQFQAALKNEDSAMIESLWPQFMKASQVLSDEINHVLSQLS